MTILILYLGEYLGDSSDSQVGLPPPRQGAEHVGELPNARRLRGAARAQVVRLLLRRRIPMVRYEL